MRSKPRFHRQSPFWVWALSSFVGVVAGMTFLSGDVITLFRWLVGGAWTALGILAASMALLVIVVWWGNRSASRGLFRHILLCFGSGLTAYVAVGVAQSRQPEARVQTLHKFDKVKTPPTPLLRRVLTDDSSEVRYHAVRYLFDGKRPASEVVAAVRPLLADSHEDASVVYCCTYALANFGPQATPAVPELILLLRRPECEVVSMAAQALAAIGPGARGAVPALLDRLDSPPSEPGLQDSRDRERCKRWNRPQPPSPSYDAQYVRLEIATALWDIDPCGGGQAGVAYIVGAIEADDYGLRCWARDRLSILDFATRKAAVPALRRQLAARSRVEANRMFEALEVADALYQTDPRTADEVLPVLISALQSDKSSDLRIAQMAMYVLQGMGADGKPALPILRDLRERFADDASFQELVTATIWWIDPEIPVD
jgi:HEAT repeat protein